MYITIYWHVQLQNRLTFGASAPNPKLKLISPSDSVHFKRTSLCRRGQHQECEMLFPVFQFEFYENGNGHGVVWEQQWDWDLLNGNGREREYVPSPIDPSAASALCRVIV